MNQPKKPKKPLTEEERAALAKELDDDLEQFMEEMAARKVICFTLFQFWILFIFK